MSADSEVAFDLSQLGISGHAEALFAGGFHRDAIRHEAQDLLNEIRVLSGRRDLDGQNLIQAALSDRNPILAFNERETRSELNQHASLRYLLLGVTTGVRNVYSHDVRTEVLRDEAALRLALMGRLRKQIEQLEIVAATQASH